MLFSRIEGINNMLGQFSHLNFNFFKACDHTFPEEEIDNVIFNFSLIYNGLIFRGWIIYFYTHFISGDEHKQKAPSITQSSMEAANQLGMSNQGELSPYIRYFCSI